MAHSKDKELRHIALPSQSVEERLFRSWDWTPMHNRGGAMSPRAIAIFWALPPRTVQRWAEAGVIPDCYGRGKRRLVRRTRATYEFMRGKYRDACQRAAKRNVESWPEEKKSFHYGLMAAHSLTRELRSWSIDDPVETWPVSFRENNVDVWSAVFADHERTAFERYPGRYGLMASAALVMQREQFSMAKLAKMHGLSRRTFYRQLAEVKPRGLTALDLKRGARALLEYQQVSKKGEKGKMKRRRGYDEDEKKYGATIKASTSSRRSVGGRR